MQESPLSVSHSNSQPTKLELTQLMRNGNNWFTLNVALLLIQQVYYSTLSLAEWRKSDYGPFSEVILFNFSFTGIICLFLLGCAFLGNRKHSGATILGIIWCLSQVVLSLMAHYWLFALFYAMALHQLNQGLVASIKLRKLEL